MSTHVLPYTKAIFDIDFIHFFSIPLKITTAIIIYFLPLFMIKIAVIMINLVISNTLKPVSE